MKWSTWTHSSSALYFMMNWSVWYFMFPLHGDRAGGDGSMKHRLITCRFVQHALWEVLCACLQVLTRRVVQNKTQQYTVVVVGPIWKYTEYLQYWKSIIHTHGWFQKMFRQTSCRTKSSWNIRLDLHHPLPPTRERKHQRAVRTDQWQKFSHVMLNAAG